MSFVRDRDAATRSVGAIAAVDHASPRGGRVRALRARQLAERDRQLAQYARAAQRPQSMGATNANNYGGLTGGARRPQISGGGSIDVPKPPTLGTRPVFVPSAGIPGAGGATTPPGGPKFLSTRYAAQVQKAVRQGQTLQTAPQELTPLNTGTGTPNTTVIVDPGPDGRVDPNTGTVDTGGGSSTTTTGGGGGSTWTGGGGGGGGGVLPDDVDVDTTDLVTATSVDAPMSTGMKIGIGLGIAALAYYLYKEGV